MRTHAHSEATRLLCAGARLNAGFRERVIDELVGHAERPVPPSLGVDLRPVLAHALQARRQEVRTALALLAVWIGFFLVSVLLTWDSLDDQFGGNFDLPLDEFLSLALFLGDDQLSSMAERPTSWVLFYAGVVLALWAGRAISGRETLLYAGTRTPRKSFRSAIRRRLGMAVTYAARAFAAGYWITAVAGITDNPYPVIFPLLMVAVVWLHRIRVTSALREQLSRETFATAQQPELPHAERYRRIGDAIDLEQHASATLYDANRPFVGAGVPHKPWSFALELRPKKDTPVIEPAVPPQAPHGASGKHKVHKTLAAQAQAQGYAVEPAPAGQPLDTQLQDGAVPEAQAHLTPSHHLSSRHVIDMIIPRLVALREATARTSRDSLRALEIEEFVYLPSGVRRDSGVYVDDNVQQHLDEAADDGGEARRHFLRIRVGSWQEQVVVSLLVRVHTQGGMLVLEVVPHVLGPVAEEFREVDAIVDRRAGGSMREGLLAFLTAPAATAAAGIAAARTMLSVFRVWLSSPEYAAPDAPLISVRELASTNDLSLFQEMDVSRYIKTVQDRIASGVRDALEQRGFRTDRFEQQIVNVRDGGVYIEDMSGGAVATGAHGNAQHVERSPV
ncbi:hypothetical protein G4Z16_11545 [Streptomyces bathyalis]|uniref:Uncharacterized protein n=1 Tax=Streptomyces bathyalis TaxID=2710756 RepID=A0A7T1T5U0_9ACTN|nr:hypothetical protein [Streptomyces bathyalis]QPP06914.1 hypothetical protein G4Z16_11545 [Streptomyces bathyalis]